MGKSMVEVIETFLWIAIGVALAVPPTMAICYRGERKRIEHLKHLFKEGCLNAFRSQLAEAMMRQADREQQAEYALGVHLEEERMKERG